MEKLVGIVRGHVPLVKHCVGIFLTFQTLTLLDKLPYNKGKEYKRQRKRREIKDTIFSFSECTIIHDRNKKFNSLAFCSSFTEIL